MQERGWLLGLRVSRLPDVLSPWPLVSRSDWPLALLRPVVLSPWGVRRRLQKAVRPATSRPRR